jgi:uncharacterized protein
MRIEVKVIPGSRKNLLTEEGEGRFKAHLTAPPVDGRANEALIELLSEHFGVRKSSVEIIKGLKTRRKTISINGI